MTLLLIHHTHTQASADADGEAGPGHFPQTLVPFCAICAEQQKMPRNRSIIQKMRRKRRGPVCTGCPENTAERPGNRVPRVLHGTGAAAFRPAVIFHILGSWRHSGPAPPEPGHHPMRQCDGSYNYRASQQKVESVRLPALVRRSSPRCCAGNRQLRSGIRELSTSSSVLAALPEL